MNSRRLTLGIKLGAMDEMVKRVVAIGAELVALERKRREIDDRMKALLNEAHRLTRPRSRADNGDPEPDAQSDGPPALPRGNGYVRLIRNNEPTLRSRVLGMFVTNATLTKYQVAETFKVTHMQAHYALTDLHKRGLIERVAQGVWQLTDKGKDAHEKLPALQAVNQDCPAGTQ